MKGDGQLRRVVYSVLLILIGCVSFLYGCPDSSFTPSLGDLCVDRVPTSEGEGEIKGLVSIYFNDHREKPRWGTICYNEVDTAVGMVMCRQLGYTQGTTDPTSDSSSELSPWIYSLNCSHDPTKQHILRCNYELFKATTTSTQCPQNLQVILTCNTPKLIDKPYDGQVQLYPPAGTPPGHQISFGLLLVSLNGQLGRVNQLSTSNVVFGSPAADSVCRQLGYTQADPASITTAANSNYTFNISKLSSVQVSTVDSWLRTNEINKCSDSSRSCFSCCYDYPKQLCDNSICLKDNGIVLRCLFDPYIEDTPSEGTNITCKFPSEELSPSSCYRHPETYMILTYAFGGTEALLMVAFVITLICCIVLCVRRRRDQDPERQRLLQQPPPEQRRHDLRLHDQQGDEN